jgi:hypothetical protein
MSFTRANDPTQYFSVVGPAYVAERHLDRPGHLTSAELEQLKIGVTGLWISFFAAIGISLLNNSQAAKAVHLASTALH